MDSQPEKAVDFNKKPGGITSSERHRALQNLIDQYPTSMCSVDRDYRYTAFNQTHVLGMSEVYGAQIELGKNFLDYILNPEYREMAKQKLDRAFIDGEEFKDQGYLINPNSYFNVSYIPIKDETNTVIGVSIFAEDVTELKKKDDALKDIKTDYYNLFENINSIILIIDPETKSILDANRTACTFYGYSHADLTQLKISDLTDEEIQYRANKITEGKTTQLQHTHRLANGELREVDIYAGSINFKGKRVNLAVVHDVSARKATEDKLRASEDNYRTFVEQSFDGIIFVNEQGNITEWNHAFEILTGLKKEDVLGRPYWDIRLQLMSPELQNSENLQRIKSNALEILKTGQSPFFNRSSEGEMVTASGERKIIEEIAFPVKMKNGCGVRSLSRDITARKQAEEKLRESEERFRLLFEKSQAVMLIVEPANGEIVDANSAAANFYGYSLNKLRGMPIEQINTLATETVRAEIQRATSESRNFFIFPHRLANGEIHTVEVHSSPIMMKNRQVLFSIVHDITERVRAEEAHRESESKYRLLFENMQEGFALQEIITDENDHVTDFRFLDANAAYERHTGLKPSETVGKTMLEVMPKADLRQIESYGRVALTGEPLVFEYHSNTFNRYLRVRTFSPQHRFFATIFEDITEQKKAESELQAAHDLLEQRVRERTAELQTAVISLEKAGRVKNEFLSSMSHELRTPLTGILGNVEMLQMQVYGSLTEKQSRALNNIDVNGKHLMELLKAILDFSQLQSGTLSQSVTTCSLGEICISALETIASSSVAKHQQTGFTIKPDVILLQTDEQRVRQILLNLLDNASKFTPEGGRFGIDVSGDREYNLVKISVWDTGIGIRDEDQSKLFHPFIQLDARLARDYEGVGLGLAVVKQLTELFGGSISVESTPFQGSRFTITLPWLD